MTLLAAAAFSYTSLQRVNEQLTTRLEAASANIAEREAEVRRLSSDVQSAEAITQQLLDERDRLAEIESRYQASNERLLDELNEAQAAINELRLSNHEDVKHWANTRIPDDARRLLRSNRTESSDQNSDDNHASIFGTTGKPYRPVYRTQF